MNLESIQQRADNLLARYRHAKQQVLDEKQYLKSAVQRVKDSEEAQSIVQQIAQEVQMQVHHRIASVVTRCLQTVFGEQEAYQFRIEFLRRRGRTEAKLSFLRDGNEVSPKDAAGGGVCDVASFALRLAALMLSQPASRRLLILDEPFKMLSAIYRPAARQLIETLSEEMSVQMVLVTHSEELMMGKVISLD